METLVTSTKLVAKLSHFLSDNPMVNEGFDGATIDVSDMTRDEILQATATTHIAYVKSVGMLQKSMKQSAGVLCKEESPAKVVDSVMNMCGKAAFANFDPCFLNIATSLQQLVNNRHVVHEGLAGLSPALAPLVDVFPSREHLAAFMQQRVVYSLGDF